MPWKQRKNAILTNRIFLLSEINTPAMNGY